MGIRLRSLPKFQFLTDAGAPGNGYKVYCYLPGTTTLKDSYTDYAGGTPNANPVILNARGEANIWFNGIYKLKITDADDVEVYTVDNYGEGEDSVLTGNYVKNKNGGFETDTAGDGLPDDWTITEYDATSTVLIDATDQIEGLNSLKFTSTGLGGGYADSDYFEVRKDSVETVTFSIKSSVVDVRNVVDILWYTSAKSLISTSNIYDDSATNPTSWTQKNGTATAPATARFAKIRVTGCHSSDATNGSTWFDDIRAISAATTTEYGVVERATQAEVDAGTDTGRHVTPETHKGSPIGEWTYISEQVASASANLDFAGLDGTYDELMFIFDKIKVTVGTVTLEALIAHSGVSYETTSYKFTRLNCHSNAGAVTNTSSNAANQLDLGTINATAGDSFSGRLFLTDPADTTNNNLFTGQFTFATSVVVYTANFAGMRDNAGAVTAVRFQPSSSTIASGKILMYGRRK